MTIHQTNDVTVRDVVGYNTYGHGFFIEDGVEENNTFDHNLGILVKPGIVLPTDRHDESCIEIGGQETFYTDKDGKRTYEKINKGSCNMLSGEFSIFGQSQIVYLEASDWNTLSSVDFIQMVNSNYRTENSPQYSGFQMLIITFIIMQLLEVKLDFGLLVMLVLILQLPCP